MTWITRQPLPVPVTQKKHLVTVRRMQEYPPPARYHYRTALAVYIHRFTEESNYDEDWGEYHENRDEYYLPEGWYEVGDSHPDYWCWPIDGDVVALQPAPKAWEPDVEPQVAEPQTEPPTILCDRRFWMDLSAADTEPHDPAACPRCNGTGYDPYAQPMCCGNGTVHGCCGEPIPERGPCPDCHGTGNNYHGTGIPEELWGLESPGAAGGFQYPCRVCREHTDIMCDPTEFQPDMHYCGRSPACCP